MPSISDHLKNVAKSQRRKMSDKIISDKRVIADDEAGDYWLPDADDPPIDSTKDVEGEKR